MVFSSSLQDAIAPIVDMTYESEARRFVMVVNRFKWEVEPIAREVVEADFGSDEEDELPPGAMAFQRTNCGIRFHHVRAVRRRGIDLADRGTILNLLSIRADASTIQLDFAGGASLVLAVDRLDGLLEDLGEPWLTFRLPEHMDAQPSPTQQETPP